ncbi:MAG TPA: type II toxin-antitoxin system HicA family toxin [Verrucomicrobiota bacterium]|nr:type II toxin-antitoxin system HicA family toxin [Verrucomicrobiota bacterium]
MKRRELIRHLEAHGCRCTRGGGEHTLYANPVTGEWQAVPRHTEVPDLLARKIFGTTTVSADQ